MMHLASSRAQLNEAGFSFSKFLILRLYFLDFGEVFKILTK